ncbi:helix-turn-helix domain-containing protein [Phyllobacterium sp. 22229]|uniref:helix-turn-helix domain-containing protein n=1 Tax=Phyllobacterium sp. 22229 TaxID=3453895 RepID=UPI003F8368C3
MKLDLYLTSKNISDEAFGQRIGLSQSQVNRIRNGKSKPTIVTIARIDSETEGVVSFPDFIGDETGREITA